MKNDKSMIYTCFAAGMFLLFSLAGCSTISTRPVVTPIQIPDTMYQCIQPMQRPTGRPIQESDVARYITSLEESNADCRLSLDQIRILVQCYNDRNCDENTLRNYMEVVRQRQNR